MKKIIAFGASNSKTSINKQLATYTANLLNNTSIEIIDLNDYEMPIYSTEKEVEIGIPKLAQDFYNKIGKCDLIIISIAEHNGTYTTAFKNIFDWTSRINQKNFQEKDVLLLSTSPGPRGASTALEIAKNRFPYHAANIVGSFSLPSFQENFNAETGISNIALKEELLNIIKNI
jgi:chromate reductase, NAD(P)H dehydrogenase (quinone)